METISTGINPRTQVFVIFSGLVILGLVLNLVQNKHIREQYSLLWISAALVLVLSAVFIDRVDKLAHAVGIYYAPAFLFLIALLLVLALQIHFSIVISKLREQNKALTQDLGILSAEVRELRNGWQKQML